MSNPSRLASLPATVSKSRRSYKRRAPLAELEAVCRSRVIPVFLHVRNHLLRQLQHFIVRQVGFAKGSSFAGCSNRFDWLELLQRLHVQVAVAAEVVHFAVLQRHREAVAASCRRTHHENARVQQFHWIENNWSSVNMKGSANMHHVRHCAVHGEHSD